MRGQLRFLGFAPPVVDHSMTGGALTSGNDCPSLWKATAHSITEPFSRGSFSFRIVSQLIIMSSLTCNGVFVEVDET